MFTGLIEETGMVKRAASPTEGKRLEIEAPKIGPALELGDSTAVNGCCLTLSRKKGATLHFDLLQETLVRTNLGDLPPGALVNLERALALGGRLGGHIVQGHIDETGEIERMEQKGADVLFEVAVSPNYRRYLAEKGSIAVDGISLTIAEVTVRGFLVWIIPHTWQATNLHRAKVGQRVNLEFDLLAKYVERLTRRDSSSE